MRNWFHRFAGRSMYANVMSTVAVFGMLGGTAYAANTLIISNSRQVGTGTIVSRNLKDGQGVQLRDLTKATRTALKGQKGATGPAGPKGNAGTTGATGAAGTSIFGSSIPSGKTVTGAWGGRYIAPQLAYNNSYLLSYSFPIKAPVPLSDAQVNVAPYTGVVQIGSAAVAGDADSTCTGSVDAPTAPAGKVCIYIGSFDNATVTGFKLIGPGTTGTQPGDAYGFIVRIIDGGKVGNTATEAAEGTWAYTAP